MKKTSVTKTTKPRAKKVEKHVVHQMLRTCSPKMEGASQRLVNGQSVKAEPFIWEEGKILVAEDYDPSPACGGGLHGLKNGVGNWNLLDWSLDAIGVIFENVDCPIIEIDGDKVKVQKAKIIESGPFPKMLGKMLPAFIRNLIPKTEIDVITVSVSEGNADSASGDSSKQAASGDYSKQAASGYSSTQAASGDSSKQAASGYSSKQAASGYSSTQAASGYSSKQAASGDYSTQAASGDYSTQAASGYSSKQAASGDYSTQAASGYSSKQAASGDYSKQAASGYSSTQAASGDSSKQAASGYSSKQAASGDDAVIVSAGLNGRAKIGKNGAIALTYKDSKDRNRIAVGYEGEGLKADTWYKVNKKGEFIED